jgi:hypothetical protein
MKYAKNDETAPKYVGYIRKYTARNENNRKKANFKS